MDMQVLDHAEANAWITQWHGSWEAETDAWAVTNNEPDQVIGRIALRGITLAIGIAEPTHWVLPSARGHGVAAHASDNLARWAVYDLRLHRLELRHSVANAASCRATAPGTGHGPLAVA